MAFITKKDYCGFARTGVLECSSETDGASASDVTSPDENGDVAAYTNVSGGKSPSNSYDIKADVQFSGANVLNLCQVTTVDGAKFMGTSVNFGTTAGAAATFSAGATDVESTAVTGVVYQLPAFTLPKTHRAAFLFSEATLAGDANLYSTSYSGTVDPGVDRDEMGVPYASSPSNGVLTCQVTVNQTGATEPTLTPATGWHVSTPLARANNKGAYPSWTATLTYYLTRVEPEG